MVTLSTHLQNSFGSSLSVVNLTHQTFTTVMWRMSITAWNCQLRWIFESYPDSKVHGAFMGPIWDRQDPGGPHVVPLTLLSGNCSKSKQQTVSVQYIFTSSYRCCLGYWNLFSYIVIHLPGFLETWLTPYQQDHNVIVCNLISTSLHSPAFYTLFQPWRLEW